MLFIQSLAQIKGQFFRKRYNNHSYMKLSFLDLYLIYIYIYICIFILIGEKLITIDEIDPVGRHIGTRNRTVYRPNTRHTAFEVSLG